MIIKALTIENFKGIREPMRVEFKPITLLFGPNSAGKSTIVQALHYVREIIERNNVDADRTGGADESFDLGGFRNLVHNHDLNLPIRFKFDLAYSPSTEFPADLSDFLTGSPDNAWIEIEVKWSNFLNAPLVFSTKIGLDDEYFAKIVCAEDGKRAMITEMNMAHHLLAISDEGYRAFWQAIAQCINPNFYIPSSNDKSAEEFIESVAQQRDGTLQAQFFIDQQTALPQYVHLNRELRDESDEIDSTDEDSFEVVGSTWETLNDFFHTYFGGLTSVLRDELKKFRYVGPIRKIPPRFFTPVRTKDETRWTSGLAAWDVLHKADDDFIQKTNQWLANENRLNSGYRTELKRFKEIDVDGPIFLGIKEGRYADNEAYEELIREELAKLAVKTRVLLREEGTGLEVLPQDIGVGISQVLPVIVVALYSTTGIVAIEQPELHIHPAFQVALGDLFISQIKERDVCFLLETHSEHLLLRLMRRIRETSENELPPDTPELKPEELAIHYIEQSEEGMQISDIRIDKDGDFIDEWPRGFFPERYGELY